MILFIILSYLEGVVTCMQRSYTYLEMHCPSSKLDIVDSFQLIVQPLCTEYKPGERKTNTV
jgi:hypothetical protein